MAVKKTSKGRTISLKKYQFLENLFTEKCADYEDKLIMLEAEKQQLLESKLYEVDLGLTRVQQLERLARRSWHVRLFGLHWRFWDYAKRYIQEQRRKLDSVGLKQGASVVRNGVEECNTNCGAFSKESK